MPRRTITWLLTAALTVYQMGCISTDVVHRSQISPETVKGTAIVITNDSRVYTFEPGKFKIHADTLFGTGRVSDGNLDTAFSGAIPLKSIDLVEVKHIDAAGTILGTIGVIAAGVATIFLVAVIVYSSSSHSNSCPFVYTFDGTSYHFESETFSGAVFNGAERTSYDLSGT
jgi:hypothetical protein